MNKKGFTLVELIGVVVLIGIIALIAIPSVDYLIKKTKDNAYDRTIDTLKGGLKNWVTDNKELIYEDGEQIIVTLADLKEQGYIDFDIKNPSSSYCLDNTMEFKITKVKDENNDKYEYEIIGNELVDGNEKDCEALTRTPSIYLLGDNPQKIEITNNNTLTYEANYDPGVTAKASDGTNLTGSVVRTNNVNLQVLSKDYQVRYSVIENGISKTVIRKVYVVDTTAPILNVPEDLEVEIGEELDLLEGVTATDNSGVTPTIKTSGNVNFNKEGEYKVTYIATDKSGNSVSKERIIKVYKPYYFLQTYYSSTSEFHSGTYETKILTITFKEDINVPDNAIVTWDLSEANNNKIIGYLLEDDVTAGYYHMYVGSLGDIKANSNSTKWFYNMTSLYEINFNNFDTSSVTDMSYLFQLCSGIQKIDLSGFDTSKVTTMNRMFYGTTNLEEISFLGIDTSNVTNMDSMFYKSGVINLDLSNFDTSNVTNMRYMFGETHELVSLNISNFDTSQVTDMDSMFYNTGMNYVAGIENFVTSKVTNMDWMFACPYAVATCYNNQIDIDVSGFDTTNVTSMYQTFRGAKIKELDFSEWDTSKVTTMVNMFYGATIGTVDFENFETSSVTRVGWMFSDSNIKELDLSDFDTSKWTDMSDIFWDSSAEKINLNGWNTSNVTDMSSMFEGAYNLVELDIATFDTSKVTTMSRMFESTSKLNNLDVSNFDTSSVTDMTSMFASCGATELNVSDFDTSKVTNMSGMFYRCKNLEKLDVSNWNTATVTNMSSMFSYLYKLNSLNFEKWDTVNVTNMSYMFANSTGLTGLDLSNFNTSKVTSMSSMFSEASGLESIDVRGFNTSSVTSMSNMFSSTSKLQSLDVTSFDTSKVTSMSSMFSGTGLTNLDLSKFDTSQVINMSSMFSGSKFENLDLSNFNTSNVTNMSSMFALTSNLISLDVTSFDTSKVTDMSSMFTRATSLTSLDLSSFDTSGITTNPGTIYMFYEDYKLVTAFARTQEDADFFNSTRGKPSGLNFVIK